jgi:hypothetical protein
MKVEKRRKVEERISETAKQHCLTDRWTDPNTKQWSADAWNNQLGVVIFLHGFIR